MLVDSLLAGETDIFFNAIGHLALPACILGFFSLAYIARMTRSFMLEQLAQEYITTARVKGLPERSSSGGTPSGQSSCRSSPSARSPMPPFSKAR